MKKIIVAIAALALMASSAYAAEWNFYGEAMVYTGWVDSDPVDDSTVGETIGNFIDDFGDDLQYDEGLYTIAKIGAYVKVSDELSGRFEYQVKDGDVVLEHLYGAWNFGSGILTVGHTDTPINVAYSEQLTSNGTYEDLGLGGFGDFDNGQNAEIMLTFGGFSIAVINPERSAWTWNTDETSYEVEDGDYTNTQAVIPMIAACYKATFDMGEAQIAGGYNTFEIDDSEDIDAYGVALGAQLNFGALGMFVTGVWGQNIANLGTETASQYTGYAIYDGVDVNDCESMGGTIGVTYAVNDMLALEAGYGYIHGEFDEGDLSSSIAQSYYLQAAITLAPGVTVTPEVGMVDHREAGTTEDLYFGAAWAIAF
ncbi:hypothetical protein DO021_17020 [Desulfobacter hydrogenophilus]|uniref:Porin n=1 Tax=Desulfobacter hydrogenophilus TaxID=2291 RepID=A0A328FCU0_9BACT|nr:porin [Desulfobacter hydrogenophilus]NDY73266.1 porin [Desulfobacter hydrogenophilus]QBH13842.1 porin [Desulfobacter hydrogenophilus]RAM00857.1 hypothetical protein DO021_17020 [Desulfobacter hydrogenophilus]